MTRFFKVLLFAMSVIALFLTTSAFALTADVTMKVNGALPNGTIQMIAGADNTLEFWITNSAKIKGMSLGFELSNGGQPYSLVKGYGNIPYEEDAEGTQTFDSTLLKEHGTNNNFLNSFGLGNLAFERGKSYRDTIFFGGVDATAGQTKNIAVHLTSTLAYSVKIRIPAGQSPQLFCVKPIYVPPAGGWMIDAGTNIDAITGLPSGATNPTFQGLPTGSSGAPVADPACFGPAGPSNTAPVVADIPNQTIPEGGTFSTINLDDYVTDAESADNLITWAATSASPNSFSVSINATTRVATISFPGGEFSGSALFTFTATDPGSLSASDTARFTVTPVNDPPVVAGIPDQILSYGATFATINLDSYVTDLDNTDAEMTWSYSGNSQLTVSINGARVATITKPSADWNGNESIIFTATDPGLLSDADTATFSIAAPTPVIEITPDTLTFSAYAGGSNPTGQGAMITNVGNGTINWNASEATSWFTISSASGTAPSGFTVNVDITGLAPGSYVGDVTVTAAGAANSPQALKVILNINNPVDIKLTPDSLSFYARKGGSNPASKDVSITNAIPSGVEFDWGAIETSPWLSMSATTGKSPSTVSFSVDIAGLDVGTYNTQVEIKQVTLTAGMGVTDDIDTIYVKLLIDQPTDVEDEFGAIPKSYSLNQNYPNPFNPETVIEYNLPASGHVTLTVFNVIGQKVVDVVNGYESAGNKQAVWNGRDENGREVQSGVYFYRLTADNFSMTRKMMLLK
jgi:hypothetical protein